MVAREGMTGGLPTRSGVSGLRVRVVGCTVALLAAVGAGSTLLATELLSMRAWERVGGGLEEELDDFERYTAAVGGRAGRLPASTAARPHLEAFLSFNTADADQALVAVAGGSVRRISLERFPLRRLPAALLERWARDTAGAHPPASSAGRFETAHGSARYRIRRVRDADGTQGALVAIALPAGKLREIRDMRSAAIGLTVSAMLLGALAAWFLAGRMLRPALQLSWMRDLSREAAHELRAPLTVCRCQLMSIRDGLEAPAGSARVAIGEIDRMSRLVDDLELLGELRGPQLRPERFELEDWTQAVFERVDAIAPRAWRLDAVGEGAVRGDRDMLCQAVLNLARNAAQHTGSEAPIGIGTAVTAGAVRVWVRDTGPGVPEHDRERIFERFVRGRAPAARGAGLGLAIVRGVAAAHGGRIELDSPPGSGATFTMVLPILAGSRGSVPDPAR
jgi:two-component system OmpR family sensor kinase